MSGWGWCTPHDLCGSVARVLRSVRHQLCASEIGKPIARLTLSQVSSRGDWLLRAWGLGHVGSLNKNYEAEIGADASTQRRNAEAKS